MSPVPSGLVSRATDAVTVAGFRLGWSFIRRMPERADRLVVVLAATGLVGWFLPEVVLAVVLGLLALASLVTVVQRMLEVRRQALDLV